jgi:hypothetical protein
MTQIIEKKPPFVEAIEKMDLRDILVLQTILSERALYLNAKDEMDKPIISKPKTILHA